MPLPAATTSDCCKALACQVHGHGCMIHRRELCMIIALDLVRLVTFQCWQIPRSMLHKGSVQGAGSSCDSPLDWVAEPVEEDLRLSQAAAGAVDEAAALSAGSAGNCQGQHSHECSACIHGEPAAQAASRYGVPTRRHDTDLA